MNKKKLGYFSIVSFCLLILLVIIGPYLIKYSIDDIDSGAVAMGPSLTHLLGTDELGRDIFSRFLYGGRVSLFIGVVGAIIQIGLGSFLGVVAGYFGGIIDTIITRVIDIIMCFPFFIIAMSLSTILKPSITNIILILGIISWTGIARIIRSKVLSIKNEEYIEASKISGFSHVQIIYYHILPNIYPTIIVSGVLAVAYNILSESSLSFLGLGIRVPEASWGNMLSTAQNMRILKYYWWMWLPAALGIIITMLYINWIGEMLKEDDY